MNYFLAWLLVGAPNIKHIVILIIIITGFMYYFLTWLLVGAPNINHIVVLIIIIKAIAFIINSLNNCFCIFFSFEVVIIFQFVVFMVPIMAGIELYLARYLINFVV